MTEDQAKELAALSEEMTRSEEARYNFGFTNVAGVHGDDLVALKLREAQIEARAVEARGRYSAFMARLAISAGETP